MKHDVPAGLKTCSRCSEDKLLGDFNRQARSKDGRQTYCRPCSRAFTAAHYAANGDQYKLYRTQHRDHKREYNSTYRAANIDQIRAQDRARHSANRHVSWESQYRRRAVKYGFSPVVDSFTEAELLARWGSECYLCSAAWAEIDHVVEIFEGGPHTLENVRPCCRSCNVSKSNSIIPRIGERG